MQEDCATLAGTFNPVSNADCLAVPKLLLIGFSNAWVASENGSHNSKI